MAEVVAPGHGRHTSSIDAMAIPGGPTIEMIPNPEFSFPRRTTSPTRRRLATNDPIRPSSMHANPPPSQSGLAAHRRAVSTLPSFTFNAANASGLEQTPNTTPPETPEAEAPTTPSRKGHRRGGSEFVGGDSRLGVSSAMSSSPTKSNALPLPLPEPAVGPPAGRPRHSHRRSAAISSHDLSNIMRPAEAQPRMSTSLPTTPMELPGQSPPLDRATSAPDVHQDPFGPPLDEQAIRPPSRPRVGFSDNVEIIPRPLSTISSEGSMSTIRGGHSVNNSISSMLSLGTPSPPSTRPSRASLSLPIEDEPKPRAKSSIEISRRVEKEGEWLKSRSSNSLKRPLSEPAAAPPKTTFVEPEAPAQRRTLHKKKQSLSYALGFDRRRSEPAIGLATGDPSRSSAVSLGSLSSVPDVPAGPIESTSSTKRLRAWATAKINKKPKETHRAVSESSSRSSMRPESAGNAFVPGSVAATNAPAVETNLDAVLGTETPKADLERPASPSQPRIEISSASPTFPSSKQTQRDDDDDDDGGAMLDLDAALGPFKTPPMGGAQRQRKELHSSRMNRDFGGPGNHYHRRAESAPALPPFDSSRVSTPSQSSMADVFEEEEEEDEEDTAAGFVPKSASMKSASEEDASIGISVVDSANVEAGGLWNLGAEDGLGIRRGEWEPERPSTSYSNAASRLSTSGTDRRGSSVIEETIFEEASPVEAPAAAAVEIVDPEEEPRSSSLTKSSDSSETPTLLGPATALLPGSDGQHSMTTPDTYQTSTFSSPDFSRRQASFDASRIGTAASSIADTRTTSSCTTGEPGSEVRMSVDDVPSLTSSRSTMLSTAQANHSQRNVSDARTPSASSASGQVAAAERRSKRSSIASLSQLLSSRSNQHDDLRPKTAADPSSTASPAKKKEHRLKKLMFWKAKQSSSGNKGASRSQP